MILAGQTASPDFPGTRGSLVPVGWTPYVARLNATGTALVYATSFGGSGNHSVQGLGVDASDRPVVVGDTNSLDFPTTPGAFDTTPGNGNGDYDGYVIKFDATGGGPVFGTYLAGPPGAGPEQVSHAGHDPAGNVIVSGNAGSGFPTTEGAYPGEPGLFVARLDPTGSRLTYSAFVGPASAFEMAVGPDGVVTLAGQVSTSAFPTTPDALKRIVGGTGDAFLARLRLDGAGAADLKHSTYFGGDQSIEAVNGLALTPGDPELVTVSGFTRSGDVPTTEGALLRRHFAPVDSRMGFVARFRFPVAGGGSLLWSTLYGGPGNQSADDVVDDTGAAIVVVTTAVNNPPTTERAYDRIPGNGYLVGFAGGKVDGYAARISADGTRLLYSTLIGGSDQDGVFEAAHAGGSSVVVAGLSSSIDFPATAGTFDPVYAADGKSSGRSAPGTTAEDVFVARLTLEPGPTADTTPPPAPELLGPADGAVLETSVSGSVPETTFDWTDVADGSGVAAYHVQVSPNPEFRNDFDAELRGWFEPWLPTSVMVTSFSLAVEIGTFHWRAQALDGVGDLGPWSELRSFTIPDVAVQPPPTPLNPPNNGKFRPGDIPFERTAVAGASFYQLMEDTRPDFTSGERIFVSSITALNHTLSLTNEKRYWWRVRASNGPGRSSSSGASPRRRPPLPTRHRSPGRRPPWPR